MALSRLLGPGIVELTIIFKVLDKKIVKSPSEATLYVKNSNASLTIVSVYVDDLLVTGSNEKLVNEFKAEMFKTFEMTDLGLLTYFLGMEVKQGHDGVFICQKKFTKEILKKFHMKDCKGISQ